MDRKTIEVDATTFNQIGDLAMILNKKKKAFLKELVSNIWEIGLNFRSGANITYEQRLASGLVLIQFFGSQRVICGEKRIESGETENVIIRGLQP